MRAVLSLFCLLGLVVSFVLAAPASAPAAPARIQKRSFKVERVRNPNFKRHDGPRQLLKAYRKYGVRPPQALMDHFIEQDAARKAAQEAEKEAASALGLESTNNNSNDNSNDNNDGFGNGFANGNGGDSSQTNGNGKKGSHKHTKTVTATNMVTATATSAASSTAASGSTSGTSDATNSSSSTGANTGTVVNTPTSGDTEYLAPVSIGGQTLNMDFDTGSSDLWVFNTQLSKKVQSGHTVYDPTSSTSFAQIQGATFSISYGDGSQVAGNVGTDTVVIGGATATKQAVELATTVSESFQQDVLNDGLVGLAFSKLNTVQPTQQKTFFDNIMSDLAEPLFTADLRSNASGTYEFGAIDSSKFVGNLNFVDVNTTNGFWQFSSSSFAVGNGKTQSSGGGGQAIADTGTTLLLANANIVNGYFANVDGAVDDQSVGGITIPCDSDLPDLQLDVGGSMATVKGSDIVFAEVSSGTCFAGLQAIDSDLMIFGDIFFKSNFVVFNGGNNTIGFATHA